MNDEFDRLRDDIRAATPAPDAAKKSADIARAMEIFDRTQGSRIELRPMSDRSRFGGRIGQGVRRMIHSLSTRGAIAATTALVAVGVTFFVSLPNLSNTRLGVPETETLMSLDDALEAEAPPARATPGASGGGLMGLGDGSDPQVVTGVPRQSAKLGAAKPEPAPDMSGVMGLSAGGGGASGGQNRARSQTDFQLSGEAGVGSSQAAPPVAAEGSLLSADGFAVPTDVIAPQVPNTEEYANETANPLKVTAEAPVSTFSIDVDTASWGVVRSSLNRGFLPPAEAVRIEEMVNYFPYAYPAPEADGPPFRPTVTVTETPWNPGTEIVHIALQGRMPALEDRPPLNLVFLVDSSGSMDDPAKLPLLKQSFRLMLGELRPEDQVAIVTYAGAAGLVLEPTPAGERSEILGALDRLSAGGSTAGQAGLEQAYAVAGDMAGEGEVTRVILATDGDFNVGLSDPSKLEDYIAGKRDSGTYLSVLGFGRGNLDDATMQALAQNGNGSAAYIDTLAEARKVLVDQLSGALFPIADDVKVQIEFNPATVAEYRLIGYETRALAREDFNNDRVDAGEIGAGHAVTALYEITPTGSEARLTDPLRYGAQEKTGGTADGELGFLKLRYKAPGAATSQLMELPITDGMGAASDDTRFATAIAGFGQLLQGGTYLGDWDYADAIRLATGAKGDDPYGYRAEAVTLMRLAESLEQ